MSARLLREQEGFTLVELLIVIAIVGMLIGVTGAALMFGMSTTGQTRDDLVEAAWAQIAPGYFLTDVQSAELVSSDPACAVPGTPIVSFVWTDVGPSGVGTDEMRSTWTLAGGELRRVTCGAATSDDSIAGEVLAATVTCDGSACLSESSPATLTLTLAFTAGSDDDPRSYSLTATRRTQP